MRDALIQLASFAKSPFSVDLVINPLIAITHENSSIKKIFATSAMREQLIRMVSLTAEQSSVWFVIATLTVGNPSVFATAEVRDEFVEIAELNPRNAMCALYAIRNITKGSPSIFATTPMRNALSNLVKYAKTPAEHDPIIETISHLAFCNYRVFGSIMSKELPALYAQRFVDLTREVLKRVDEAERGLAAPNIHEIIRLAEDRDRLALFLLECCEELCDSSGNVAALVGGAGCEITSVYKLKDSNPATLKEVLQKKQNIFDKDEQLKEALETMEKIEVAQFKCQLQKKRLDNPNVIQRRELEICTEELQNIDDEISNISQIKAEFRELLCAAIEFFPELRLLYEYNCLHPVLKPDIDFPDSKLHSCPVLYQTPHSKLVKCHVEDRTLCIKIQPIRTEDDRKIYEREFQAATLIRSPFCLSPLSMFERDWKFYIVMPYYPHGSLEDQLLGCPNPQTKPQPKALENIILHFSDTLHGLLELHNCGFIHGDLKPANILIHSDASWLICDFGCVKFLDSATTTLRVTHRYAGPEMETLDSAYVKSAATDVFAVGLTFAEVLAQRCGVRFTGPLNDWVHGTTTSGKGFMGIVASDGDFSVEVADPSTFQRALPHTSLNILGDFIRCLLHRDPLQRPPIVDLLQHKLFSSNPTEGEPTLMSLLREGQAIRRSVLFQPIEVDRSFPLIPQCRDQLLRIAPWVPLRVHFTGGVAIDAGGPSKELLMLLFREATETNREKQMVPVLELQPDAIAFHVVEDTNLAPPGISKDDQLKKLRLIGALLMRVLLSQLVPICDGRINFPSVKCPFPISRALLKFLLSPTCVAILSSPISPASSDGMLAVSEVVSPRFGATITSMDHAEVDPQVSRRIAAARRHPAQFRKTLEAQVTRETTLLDGSIVTASATSQWCNEYWHKKLIGRHISGLTALREGFEREAPLPFLLALREHFSGNAGARALQQLLCVTSISRLRILHNLSFDRTFPPGPQGSVSCVEQGLREWLSDVHHTTTSDLVNFLLFVTAGCVDGNPIRVLVREFESSGDLPTALTCFSMLFFPPYTDTAVVKVKLIEALKNIEDLSLH